MNAIKREITNVWHDQPETRDIPINAALMLIFGQITRRSFREEPLPSNTIDLFLPELVYSFREELFGFPEFRFASAFESTTNPELMDEQYGVFPGTCCIVYRYKIRPT